MHKNIKSNSISILIWPLFLLLLIASPNAVCQSKKPAPLFPPQNTDSAQSHLEVIQPTNIGLNKKNGIKIVFHINTVSSKKGVNKGLHYISYIIDHYRRLGIEASSLKISAVVYGDAINILMRNHALRDRAGRGKSNPNGGLVRKLIQNGISIEACGETLRMRKIPSAHLLPGISIVPGSYVRIIELQMDGYAYLKF